MSADPDKAEPLAGPAARENGASAAKIAVGIAAVAGIGALYVVLARSGLVDLLSDKAALRAAVDRLGAWGPAAIVALVAVAIVASPLPSAPVALAAGAIYGAAWGAVLIVAGAVLGALVAFVIARCFAFEAIRRWSMTQRYLEVLSQEHSQSWLMGAVFASRLIPFISFDAVSYIAGLTPLKFWRFALATFAGIIPVSFGLTYAGETLIGVSSDLMMAVIAVLVAVPFVAAIARTLWRAARGS